MLSYYCTIEENKHDYSLTRYTMPYKNFLYTEGRLNKFMPVFCVPISVIFGIDVSCQTKPYFISKKKVMCSVEIGRM